MRRFCPQCKKRVRTTKSIVFVGYKGKIDTLYICRECGLVIKVRKDR